MKLIETEFRIERIKQDKYLTVSFMIFGAALILLFLLLEFYTAGANFQNYHDTWNSNGKLRATAYLRVGISIIILFLAYLIHKEKIVNKTDLILTTTLAAVGAIILIIMHINPSANSQGTFYHEGLVQVVLFAAFLFRMPLKHIITLSVLFMLSYNVMYAKDLVSSTLDDSILLPNTNFFMFTTFLAAGVGNLLLQKSRKLAFKRLLDTREAYSVVSERNRVLHEVHLKYEDLRKQYDDLYKKHHGLWDKYTALSQQNITEQTILKSSQPSSFKKFKEILTKVLMPAGRLAPEKSVFISYSHKDHDWLEKVKVQFDSLEGTGKEINYFVDTQIPAGVNFEEKIREALQSARIAIFLVSAHLLSSEYIRNVEQEVILIREIPILWVLLRHCPLEGHIFNELQCIHDPSRPLNGLPEASQDAIMAQLVVKTKNILYPPKQ